jgi:2-iminoacetate synthase
MVNPHKEVPQKEVSLYTCLYVTNRCINDCDYCGFRRSNKNLERITLTPQEIRLEAESIKDTGVTNAILIGGTLPEKVYANLIMESAKILKETGLNPWIEFENLSIETLRALVEIGATKFLLFQETYNPKKYRHLHQNSPAKNDYETRMEKISLAIKAGFLEVGIGALFGLHNNYSQEITALTRHVRELQTESLSISVHAPTLRPAPGVTTHSLSDDEVKGIYASLRVNLPDAYLALSGRESETVRDSLFPLVDYIGTGGVPNPGGRTKYKTQYQKGDTQFELLDNRTPLEIREHLQRNGIKIVSKF